MLAISVIYKERARVWIFLSLKQSISRVLKSKRRHSKETVMETVQPVCYTGIRSRGFIGNSESQGAGLGSGGLEGCICFPRKAGLNSVDESIFLDLTFSCLAFQGQ